MSPDRESNARAHDGVNGTSFVQAAAGIAWSQGGSALAADKKKLKPVRACARLPCESLSEASDDTAGVLCCPLSLA